MLRHAMTCAPAVVLSLTTAACHLGCPDVGFGGTGACAEDPPCHLVPAVVVDVRNAETGEVEVASPRSGGEVGARGLIRDGGYRDSLRASYGVREGHPVLAGGEGRSGTYTVVVEKAGFAPWVRKGIEVGAGECGPETRRLAVELEPARGS